MRLKPKGELRELRIYEDHKLVMEIAYHPEPKLNGGDRETNVLHYHIYDEKLNHGKAQMITRELKEKYKKYLKEFGLYD